MNFLNQFFNEDIFDPNPSKGLNKIPPNSIDLIFADLPYNMTQNPWDQQPINLSTLWSHLNRIAKPNTPFIFTSKEPFTSTLIFSNKLAFKFKMIWRKNLKSNFLNANFQPMSAYEEIPVFYYNKPTYNPQKIPRTFQKPAGNSKNTKSKNYNPLKENYTNNQSNLLLPDDIIDDEDLPTLNSLENETLYIKCQHGSNKIHPNQKPIELLSYLIKTFSNPNDIILDPTAGSGSTAFAAHNLNRNFILFDNGSNSNNVPYKDIFDSNFSQYLQNCK